MAGPFSIRALSRSIPRRALTTYRHTINKIHSTKSTNEFQYASSICILLMIVSIAVTFQPQTTSIRKEPTSNVSATNNVTRIQKDTLECSNNCTYCPVTTVSSTGREVSLLGEVKEESVIVEEVNSPDEDFTRAEQQFTYREERLTLTLLLKVICLSILTVVSVILLHLKRTLSEQVCLASAQSVTWQLLVFRLLPLRTLSRINGRLTRIHIPVLLRTVLWSIFIKLFNVNISEALDERLSSYKCFQELFKRKLKPCLRPIDISANIVCPVDGTVVYVGRVHNNNVEQIKGITYSLSAFLGRGLIQDGMSLYSAVLYLSPGDYHQFHSPTDWNINLYRHFPGELVTVSPWAVKRMPGLFALNERVLLSGQWPYGYFSLTAVGAFNVGSIYLDNYKDLSTNIKGHYKFNTYNDKHTSQLSQRGEHLGGFNIGSTIVLLFEAPPSFHFTLSVGNRVQYGQPLGNII